MLSVIQNRPIVSKFKSLDLEQDQLDDILYAAQYSPSVNDTRAWEFVTVKDMNVKEKLAKTRNSIDFVKESPIVLVLCSKDWEYWVEDLSIVTENILVEASNQGLGGNIIQVWKNKTQKGEDCENFVRNILSIPEEIRILNFIPLGYPEEVDHRSDEVMLFERNKLHQNQW